MKIIHAFLFLVVALFAASLRAKPFSWEGSDAAARVAESRVLGGFHAFFTPESAADKLIGTVHARAGEKGLRVLAMLLFAVAAVLAVDAGRWAASFGAASIAALLVLPLGMREAAPGSWLMSSVLAGLFLSVHMRCRQGAWPPVLFFTWAVLGVLWPFFHQGGVVLVPFLSLICFWDAVHYRRYQDNLVEGGVYTGALDPLLFRAEDLDMEAFQRVIRWETKMNQFLHQRLGLSPERLPSLTAGRAAEVLNTFLDIPDLPQQAAVPDPGTVDGDIRARNRRILDIQYKDALHLVARKDEAPRGPVAETPLNLWAPTVAAATAAVLALVSPAGISALFRLGASLPARAGAVAAPGSWWVWGPRDAAPGLPYYWLALGLLCATAAVGAARNRARFSPALFAGGAVVWLAGLTLPGAAAFLAAVLIPVIVAPLRGLWREDNLIRGLSAAAVFIVLGVALFLLDWDRFPLAG